MFDRAKIRKSPHQHNKEFIFSQRRPIFNNNSIIPHFIGIFGSKPKRPKKAENKNFWASRKYSGKEVGNCGEFIIFVAEKQNNVRTHEVYRQH